MKNDEDNISNFIHFCVENDLGKNSNNSDDWRQ